jgi:predicted RNase H-like HicB family nuclease
MDMFVFTGIILQDQQTFTGICPELDIASQGATPAEAKEMLLEAASLHLIGAIEDGLPYLRPIPASEDPRQAAPELIVETFRLKANVAVQVYA